MADDVEDSSLMRRGQPCTHLKFGVDYAVNTSSFMYFSPLARLADFVDNPLLQSKLMRIFI